jgi:hypothetical protein
VVRHKQVELKIHIIHPKLLQVGKGKAPMLVKEAMEP